MGAEHTRMNKADWRIRPVAGIGIVGLDHVAVTDLWERDTKSTATHYFEQVGGPVPVALMAMARLGMTESPGFHTALGGDKTGDRILELLNESRVDTRPVRRTAPSLGAGHSIVVLNTSDGTRSVVNSPADYLGSNYYIPLRHQPDPLIDEAGLLHIDMRNLIVNQIAARDARSKGAKVSWDLGSWKHGFQYPQDPWLAHAVSHCDIVIASKPGGASAFVDIETQPIEQVKRFLGLGATVAGVTLGAGGVAIGSRDENGGEPVHLPAFKVENVVDTCGAGDLFHGAFLWAYREGKTVIDSAIFAQAAVALRIQHYGNVAGQPTREQVEAFLATR